MYKKKQVSDFSQRRRQAKYTPKGNFLKNYYNFLPKYCILFATRHGILTKQQIESARRTIRKFTGRKTKVNVLTPSYMPITKKAKQSRMGKGKGKIYNFISYVYPGKALFSIRSRSYVKSSTYALLKSRVKLPIPVSGRFKTIFLFYKENDI